MKSPTPHDKINLARLLSRLDTLVHAGPTPLASRPWWELRKLNDDAKYARELLDLVASSEAGQTNRGEGTSTTLDEYELKLNKISMTLILAVSDPVIPKGPVYAVLPPAPISIVPATLVPTAEELDEDAAAAALSPTPPPLADEPTATSLLEPSPAPEPLLPAPTSLVSDASPQDMGIRPEPAREPSPPPSVRALGAVAPPTTSLLADASPPPVRAVPTAREQLGLRERRTRAVPADAGKAVKDASGGAVSEGLMSTSRVHDELTEQLAMMSTQLRKNAAHFATSIEAEKPLLEQSSALLEGNLTKVTGSKGRLSAVSSKGRGNTWLVLASVAAVCLLWVWMYFVIRFT